MPFLSVPDISCFLYGSGCNIKLLKRSMRKYFQKNPLIFILSVLVVVQSFFLFRAYFPKQTSSTAVSSQKTISSDSALPNSTFSFTVNDKKYDCTAINGEVKNNIKVLSDLISSLKDAEDQNVQAYVEKINNCGTEKEYELTSEDQNNLTVQPTWAKLQPTVQTLLEEYRRIYPSSTNHTQSCKKFWEEAMIQSDTESSFEVSKWENEIEKLLSKNSCVAVQQPTNQSNTGYIRIKPRSISVGGKVAFEYGYKDPLNNEHLNSAITTVSIITPSKKRYSSLGAKIYPGDFPGSSTTEPGIYRVNVERAVETTSGNKDVLFSAAALFFVDGN